MSSQNASPVLSTDNSDENKKFNITTLRITMSIILIIGIIAVSAAFTFAWFTGYTTNANNRISAASSTLRLITTDLPLKTDTSFPQTVNDLFIDGNSLISLDDAENNDRKFFEYNGEGVIENVQPDFKLRRPLIIANESASDVTYTVDFISRKLGDKDLRSAFYLNYSKSNQDVFNADLIIGDTTSLTYDTAVQNLGTDIKTIGSNTPIKIPANSAHIYIVDFGILHTAGSSYIGAGMELDIILTTVQDGNSTRTIKDISSFKNALATNKGGETLLLVNDIIVNEALVTNHAFNLDLNGNNLVFEDNGMLQVIYPERPATIDIGSKRGGFITNALSISFIGYENMSTLNWYSDLTDADTPTTENVNVNIVVADTIRPEPPSSTNSSVPSSSSPTPSSKPEPPVSIPDDKYKDYTSIIAADFYADGNGKSNNPYVIESLEQFKLMIEDSSTSKNTFFKINTNIKNVKNISSKIKERSMNLIFADGVTIENIHISSSAPTTNSGNPFQKAIIFNEDGYTADYATYIFNVTYNN